MTTQHTPGPWVALPEEADKDYLRIRGTELGGRYKIANVHTPIHDNVILVSSKESFANARLIAAAPDLLALHKKHIGLMVEIAMELKNPRLPLGTTVAASIRMLAEAAKETIDAIAKATGEKI